MDIDKIKIIVLILAFIGLTIYTTYDFYVLLQSENLFDFIISSGGIYLISRVVVIIIFIAWAIFIFSLPKIPEKSEQLEILEKELERYRLIPYNKLVIKINEKPYTLEKESNTGKKYYIEIITHWDGKPDGNVRVHGCIDDGGVQAYSPLSSDFIKSSNNEFIDE